MHKKKFHKGGPTAFLSRGASISSSKGQEEAVRSGDW